MNARCLAQRCVEGGRRWLLGTGALGIVTFVLGSVAVAREWLGVEAYLGVVGLALLVYSASLLVGYLGVPPATDRERQARSPLAHRRGSATAPFDCTTRRLSVP